MNENTIQTLTLRKVFVGTLVCTVLGVYVFGVQLAYESPTNGHFTKALLFMVLILRSGLSWDILKFVLEQSDASLKAFFWAFLPTLAHMFWYSGLLAAGYLLLGKHAGELSTVTIVYAAVSLPKLYDELISFSNAATTSAERP